MGLANLLIVINLLVDSALHNVLDVCCLRRQVRHGLGARRSFSSTCG